MATITFQPVLRSMKEVLSNEFLEIPRFQRPYSWSIENLQDFLRDVIFDNDEGYFIGPMVGYDIAHDRVGLVDGQQRVTSVTLTLCAIRDLFLALESHDSVTGITKYIERADDDAKLHYILKSATVDPYLHTQFQTSPPHGTKSPKNEEERSLTKAFDQILSALQDEVEPLSTMAPGEGEPSPAVVRLRQIRDRILALKVIWIRLDSEDDAYVIFETLNSRGKDLEVVDLLKNLLLQKVRAENGDLDTARLNWADMRRELEDRGLGVNPNKYILHWWLSGHEYTAERKLFRNIKRSVTEENASLLLEQLKSDSIYYARIANPADWKIKQHEKRVRDSLLALAVFGVSQPRPLLLAVLRSYSEKKISFAWVRKTLTAVENFHFITTAIVGVSSTGGISEMYAKHARELTAAKSKTERAHVLAELIAKLTDPARLPSRESFVSEFPRTLRFSEQESNSKRLVQYTLRRLHDHTAPGPLDHARCNIEHLSPQKDDEPWMPSIGNLLWIDSDLNGELGTKLFSTKKAILKKAEAVYDISDVLAASDWGEAEVVARSKRLAELAFDEVWKTGN